MQNGMNGDVSYKNRERRWEGHSPRGQVKFHPDYPLPQSVINAARPPVPPVEILTFEGVEIRSDHMPYKDGRPITDPFLFPSYVRRYYETGSIDVFRFPVVERVRKIREPVFHAMHFNGTTYGHFLLEVLPKILAFRACRGEYGFKIAVAENLRSIASIFGTLFTPEEILGYNSREEIIWAPMVMLASNIVSPRYDLHDVFVQELAALTSRFRSGEVNNNLPGPRIFISRQKHAGRSFRKLGNEADLLDTASQFGFDVFYPEDWAWSDQIRIFANATHVVGEYTSALHNTLFSPPGTKVLSLGWLNGGAVQAAISTAMQHEVACILFEGGVEPIFDPRWTDQQILRIDETTFRRCLSDILASE